MVPSPVGPLQLFAGGSIAPVSLAMLDADPSTLPNWFGIVGPNGNSLAASWVFPAALPSTSELALEQLHNRNATHAGDSTPVRIAAGTDIGTASSGLILSVPKRTRIYAGRDIIHMMFFRQNLSHSRHPRYHGAHGACVEHRPSPWHAGAGGPGQHLRDRRSRHLHAGGGARPRT